MPGTGTLIGQFCEAAEKWARESGERSPDWIVLVALALTGGSDRYPGVGAVDPAPLSPAQRAKLTMSDVAGQHTVDQIRDWLSKITGPRGLDEEFVVLGLVAALDRMYEEQSEEYAVGVAQWRARYEHLKATSEDENATDEWIKDMNEVAQTTPRLIEGMPSQPYSRARLLELLEVARKFAEPSLVAQRDRRRSLDIWRAVTAPIVDRENLRTYREELNRKLFRSR